MRTINNNRIDYPSRTRGYLSFYYRLPLRYYFSIGKKEIDIHRIKLCHLRSWLGLSCRSPWNENRPLELYRNQGISLPQARLGVQPKEVDCCLADRSFKQSAVTRVVSWLFWIQDNGNQIISIRDNRDLNLKNTRKIPVPQSTNMTQIWL